ncbi:MAG: hypothetical protein ACK4F9_05720 [Brevinematia bacterium]
MDEIDKIRKKIGIDSLDRELRDKLFKDFVKSGGKVLTDKEIMKQKIKETISKSKNISNFNRNILKTPQTKNKPIQTQLHQKTTKNLDQIKISFIDTIKIFLKAYFQNLITLNGFIKNKFFEKTLRDVPAAFNDLRIIGYVLTSKDEKITNTVKENLNAISPIAYEIIYRFNHLPTNDLFEKSERMYKFFAQTRETTKPENIKDILKYIFKKLYLLYPYKEQSKVFVITAIRSISKYLPKSDLQKMEKLFIRTWDFLFEEYYNQAKTIINLIIGKEIPITSEHMIKFLEIKEEDYIGYLTEKAEISKIKEEKPKEAKEQEEQKEKKVNAIDEGINLINLINIRKIQESIKRKESYVEYNDKIFLTEALIEFYERDIYPVLVLKARYNIIFEASKTIDIKKTFDDIYANLRTLRDKINDYYKVVEDVKTIESDVTIPLSKKSGLINTRNLEKTRLSYQIRKEFTEVLGRIKNNLEIVLSDYKSNKNILSNPEDTVEFNIDKIKDLEIERNFFEGENVIRALEKIYNIISAMIFLFVEGDLGGSNVLLEKQIYLNLGESIK